MVGLQAEVWRRDWMDVCVGVEVIVCGEKQFWREMMGLVTVVSTKKYSGCWC